MTCYGSNGTAPRREPTGESMGSASRSRGKSSKIPTLLWNRTGLKAENADGKRLETVDGVLLLLVAHNVEYGDEGPEETIRIISARRASRRERKSYEEERQKNYF